MHANKDLFFLHQLVELMVHLSLELNTLYPPIRNQFDQGERRYPNMVNTMYSFSIHDCEAPGQITRIIGLLSRTMCNSPLLMTCVHTYPFEK